MATPQGSLLVCTLCVMLWTVGGQRVVVKRSDDVDPQNAVVQQLASDLTDVRAQLQALRNDFQTEVQGLQRDLQTQVQGLRNDLQALRNDLQSVQDRDNERVAFTAYIAENNIPETSQGVIRFSHTVTNTGGAYSSVTGGFTAPYDGDYMFIASVDVDPGYQTLVISQNGQPVVQGDNDAGSSDHIVAVCVLTLAVGDVVTVNHAGPVAGIVDGGADSQFAGFRIR